MTFSSMPVGVRRGFHGTNRTGFLPVDLDVTKNDFIQQEELVRWYLFPLASRFYGKKRDLRLQGLVGF